MLIDLLWESLDGARVAEIETKWASESEDRIDAFERGELPAVDGQATLHYEEKKNGLSLPPKFSYPLFLFSRFDLSIR